MDADNITKEPCMKLQKWRQKPWVTVIFKGYIEEADPTKYIETDTHLCGPADKHYTQIFQIMQITGSKN